MHLLTDPTIALALAALVLAVLGTALLAARSRRWGAACTRCDWRHRSRSRHTLEATARHHAATSGHDVINLYRRGRA